MGRWLALSVGLAIAVVAVYALLTLPGSSPDRANEAMRSTPVHPPIDDASRARLSEILAESGREPSEGR